MSKKVILVPKLRFPEFKNNTSWKKRILADVLKEHKCKSTGSEEVLKHFLTLLHKKEQRIPSTLTIADFYPGL